MITNHFKSDYRSAHTCSDISRKKTPTYRSEEPSSHFRVDLYVVILNVICLNNHSKRYHFRFLFPSDILLIMNALKTF